MGVSPESTLEARAAILPITVLSPQRMTIPRAEPSIQLVEKNARFLDSNTSTSESSASRGWGSDSPVSEELSTFMEEAEMIRKSAGIRSPPLTSTMSPRTSSRAEMEVFSPFRKASACWGTRFLKLSMIAADFDSCMYFFRVSKVLREKNGSH